MTNTEKMQKLNQQIVLTQRLYEEQFTKADWEAKKPEAIKWFNKCQKVAVAEIWGL